MTDYNDMLMGTGGRSAKFEALGAVADGFIERIETRQRTDIKTGKPLTWDDGNPKMQLVITLDTEARDDDDDDGKRNLYVPIPSQMQKVIADAIRAKGQRGLAEGGRLWVKFVDTEAPKVKGFSATKLYRAAYSPPTVQVMADDAPPIEDEDLPF